jgi:acetyltransferase-like isoleucine patch superfamily enzyme
MLRNALKAIAHGLALVVISPLLLCYFLQALVIGRDRALEYATEWLALLPGLAGRYLRRAFLARVLAGGCHPSASIGFGTLFSQSGAGIEANVYVGPRCHLGLVHLEKDVLLAAGVHVTSGARRHGSEDVDRPIRDQEGTVSMVRIGAGTWIGSGAVVMADVGRDTIVGAGAVVTKPVPQRVIAAGVPARVVRSRDGISETKALVSEKISNPSGGTP